MVCKNDQTYNTKTIYVVPKTMAIKKNKKAYKTNSENEQVFSVNTFKLSHNLNALSEFEN